MLNQDLPIKTRRTIEEYQKQIDRVSYKLKELLEKLNKKYLKIKEKEFEKIAPEDRIFEFIGKMKPRETISLQEMANQLNLSYEQCKEIMIELANRKLLPGNLKSVSKSELIEKGLFFSKEDPELQRFSKDLGF